MKHVPLFCVLASKASVQLGSVTHCFVEYSQSLFNKLLPCNLMVGSTI
jgi:hypothetical protein